MKYGITAVCGILLNNALQSVSGAYIRDEISAWITMMGSVAITIVTISIQIYHLIHNRDKDLKRSKKHKNKKKGKRK